MCNLMKRIKSNATSRESNGAATLEHIQLSLGKIAEHGDWTYLAAIVGLAYGADRSRIVRIIEALGYKAKGDKKQPHGVRIAAIAGGSDNGAAFYALAWHVAAGNSFRSKALENAQGDDVVALLVKTTKEYDLEAAALAFAKRAAKEGVSGDAAAAAILGALKVVYGADEG